MRKKAIFFLLVLALGFVQSCKPPVDLFDFPPYQRDKKSLVVLLTAVWNDYAGETGQPNFVGAVADSFGTTVVPIVAHAATTGDPYYSLAASQFYSLYNAESYPELGLNTQGFAFRLNDWILATKAAAIEIVGGVSGPAKPKLVMALSKKVEGSNFRMKARIRFEEEMVGDTLHLAIYVTENNVIGFQEGAPQREISHMHVLRGAATPGAWGIFMGGGSFKKGQVLEYEFAFPINAFMNANNLTANGVVYRMVNQQPAEVMNANFR
ncbi:MAG: Omp28-related outer membrane protein [Sphingobacteriaceae bacterium]|nr:Omp28-related outer membrane protein [Sphingobacteriaceae bacterium]